ncbi:uncharacterized protein FTJAE_2601 [Fusarium tjaetaba]|uniref:Uncharacterized protein n=1 Tax=Fusarium tjaetaba TaxID=1567544 RepID=A0A8H5S6B7_9HYPO|nr:uncharacterized protein FTJAE_2601 [Fusarium tjaetaba]KAF5644977.1 hypothetical protein FTJAE_2601 [Fusarium tjaetaba]
MSNRSASPVPSTSPSQECDEPRVLAVPVKLDAFIFNADVCGGSGTLPDEDENKDSAKIAPFKQPNYTFLRFERSKVQNDTLEFTDLHKTGPAAFNTRFTDLGTKKPYPDRQGVYLHWIVPRGYRIGSTVANDFTAQQHARAREGFVSVTPDPEKPAKTQGKGSAEDDSVDQGDTKASDFRPAPSRWMIIRKVESCDPPNALPDMDAWVVESNRCTTLDEIPTDKDIQVEYAPYVSAGKAAADMDMDAINMQAEVFIGYKESASSWMECEVPNPLPTDPQRVDLNLVNSSNPLFADYQPHNGNVFSIIDTLKYKGDDDSEPIAVNQATVSYCVFGWHGLQGEDPFGTLDPNSKPSVTRGQRLAALKMKLDQTDISTAQGITDWTQSLDAAQLICHGVMYNVKWQAAGKPKYMPADGFFEKVQADVPVAVGTTPMDSLLTYIRSHTKSPSVDAEDNIQKVMQDLLSIEKLLHAQDDGADAQAEADDIVYNWNYANSSGGLHYFLTQGPKYNDGKPTQPSSDNIKALNDINSAQDYLNSLDRQVTALRWNMFAYWWDYLSSITEPDPIKTGGAVADMTTAFTKLVTMRNNTATKVRELVRKLPEGLAKQGALPPFSEARDPTLLVAGVESGWPWDFLHDLDARLDTQIAAPSSSIPPVKPSWEAFLKTTLSKLPQGLTDAGNNLVDEFLALNPGNPNQPAPGGGYKLPLYHDLDKTHILPNGKIPWRDRWENRQAWFPLFLEWIAEYNHVPFTPFTPVDDKCQTIPACWSLEPQESWPSRTQAQKLRYGIKTGIELADECLHDKRTVSGRVLILPQASQNLQTLVESILDNLPDGYLEPDQVEELKDHLHELAFLSSPLSGFTNHLITRAQGNHIKPTLRSAADSASNATDDTLPFKAAIEVGSKANFKDSQLRIMGVETDMTPYGTLVQVGSLNNEYCPFKPVTHGQFRFTTLNIIDKFGQAIPIIDQTPRPINEGSPPLYPCISEYYTPQVSNKDPNKANTIQYDKEKTCQYIQLPPSINQPARLNFAFVDYVDEDKAAGTVAGWRPLQEWDTNFIWGWVLPNYADSGIQLFLSDGTFFREIRLGGPYGATSSGTPLPFPAPPVSTDPDLMQLELLAERLMDADYLHSFVAMLDQALGTIAPPPNAYSEFLSSIVGRPLALVKAAYSLELASQPYTNQSTLVNPPIPPSQELQTYEFGIHLGDASRIYDGLIAYFLPQQTPTAGNSIDLNTIYTHFVPTQPQFPVPNLTQISPENYPIVKPFWQNPMGASVVGPPGQPKTSPQDSYATQWNSHLVPVGALVDPFVPFHAYSGILPTAAAQLPAWTWQTALKRMTAFFHMGPLLSTSDVPDFDSQRALTPTYNLTDDEKMVPGAGLGTPAMQTGEWAWLQPYNVSTKDKKGPEESGNDEDEKVTQFMALSLEAVDTRPRLEPSPYTAVEGYMQLRMPIQQGAKPSKPI